MVQIVDDLIIELVQIPDVGDTRPVVWIEVGRSGRFEIFVKVFIFFLGNVWYMRRNWCRYGEEGFTRAGVFSDEVCNLPDTTLVCMRPASYVRLTLSAI